MEGKVIFEGKTEKGLSVLIRYVKSDDVEILNDYINILSREQTFISYQGEEIPPEFEKEYIRKLIEKFKNREAVHLLAFTDRKLIGSVDLNMQDPKRGAIKHVGIFGISVLKDYRGQGVGKLLMNLVLKEAVKNLPNLRTTTLSVFSTNDLAREMYKNFGFVEFGKLPEGVFHKGKYVDLIYMYKKVK